MFSPGPTVWFVNPELSLPSLDIPLLSRRSELLFSTTAPITKCTRPKPPRVCLAAVFSSFSWCRPELEPCSFVIPGLGVLVPDVLPLALFLVVSICLTEKKFWNVVPRGCCCPRPCSSGCRSPCTQVSAWQSHPNPRVPGSHAATHISKAKAPAKTKPSMA